MAMDARKQRILEAIVALYANGGEPVGSGLLANYFLTWHCPARHCATRWPPLPSWACWNSPHQCGPRAQRAGLPLLPRPSD